MNAIDATAMAIFMFEGARLGDPHVRNIRNNNPGNLRPFTYGQATDAGGYRTFNVFAMGWQALISDISVKLTQHLKSTDTMEAFFKLYAPAADHNDPTGYAQFVCRWLTGALGRTVTLATTIKEIYGGPDD